MADAPQPVSNSPADVDNTESSSDTGVIEVFQEERTSPSTTRRTARLIMLVGQEAGRQFAVGLATVTIGRASDAEIRISDDDISRYHARISWCDEGPTIEDLGSKNGTSINGIPIRRQLLRVGDQVQLGSSVIMVFAQPDDLERRVQQLQKLDAMSTFAAGMAHDLRNLLMVMSVNADLVLGALLQHRPELDHVSDSIHDISDAAGRALEITGRLIDFARRDQRDEARASVQLEPIVQAVVGLIRFNLATDIKFVVDVPEHLSAQATPAAIHQVLLNLCLNARDAMPRGGTLDITARAIELSRGAALKMHLTTEGAYVELRVRDTGVGMDATTLERAFEPFFTTKAPGKGTGLGLASVFGIVRSLGGAVLADSTPDVGSEFRVLLPVDPMRER